MIFLSSQEILGVVFCRYDSIVKALNTSNETVLALGANFSLSADSHLVAMQVGKDTILVFFISFISTLLTRERMEAIKHKQSTYRTRSEWLLGPAL